MLCQVLKSACFWISRFEVPELVRAGTVLYEYQCLGDWWVKEDKARFHCHCHHHQNISLLDTMFPLHRIMRWSDSRSPIQSGQLTPRGPPHPYWHLINDNLTRTCLYCQKRILFEMEQKRLKNQSDHQIAPRCLKKNCPFVTFPYSPFGAPWPSSSAASMALKLFVGLPNYNPPSWLPLIKTILTLSHSSH